MSNEYKVGDIVSVRVKIASKTEDEGNKFTYKVKSLNNQYASMEVHSEDITGITLNVPVSKDNNEE